MSGENDRDESGYVHCNSAKNFALRGALATTDWHSKRTQIQFISLSFGSFQDLTRGKSRSSSRHSSSSHRVQSGWVLADDRPGGQGRAGTPHGFCVHKDPLWWGFCNTFSSLLILFSHDVAKQPEDNKNSPLCTKGYSHYIPKCLTKIPALIKDPTDYHSFHILRYVKVLRVLGLRHKIFEIYSKEMPVFASTVSYTTTIYVISRKIWLSWNWQ